MSYQANVYHVMIASPSDVEKEKQLIEGIIHEWNYIHSLNKKIVLLPLCWDTHSTPEMGNRAQAIINKQVLKNADLLIGVFWTRIGTPTGESISGTVEEIEKHISAKKPAMIYFSNAPAHPDTMDFKQYEELKKFKEKCKATGLIETYENLSGFRSKFSNQLAIKVNREEYFKKNELQDENSQDTKLTFDYDSLPKSQIPTLSEEAKTLLIEASNDPSGHVVQYRFSGEGLIIQTNKKTFTGANDARKNATWEAAINKLCDYDFLQEREYKGEVFAVTHAGYQMADYLKQQSL